MKNQPDITTFRYLPVVVGPNYRWEGKVAYRDKDVAHKMAFEKACDRQRKGAIIMRYKTRTILCEN